MNSEIIELEERLRQAMRRSDVTELEKLLSPDLVFTNHLGRLVTKQDDIEAHTKKTFVMESIDLSNQEMIDLGNCVVVAVQADISGSYEGRPASGKFRFTRVWANNSGSWQVVAGHSCVLA